MFGNPIHEERWEAMNAKTLKRSSLLILLVVLGLISGALRARAAQEPTFDWLPANDESVRLDPADYHTGRIYRPGDQGGNLHVDIDAQGPVTVEMASAEEWSETLRHPELIARVTFRCVREHVLRTTYVCDLPPARPMTLVIRDERDSGRSMLTGLGTVLSEYGTVREFAAPNDVHVQYYRWSCVEECNPPQFQWISELKERYELTATLKVYGGLTADRDGEPFSIKVKSPVPVAIGIVPSRVADGLRGKRDNLDSVLENGSCKQRGVESLTFECTLDAADGPQSLVVVPESDVRVPSGKRAEVEVVASKCVSNCLTDPEK
jgi:hypothetical protein